MDIDVSTARIGMMVSIFAAVVFGGVYRMSDNGFILALTLISAAGVLFFGYFNRCPHCGHGLFRVPIDTLHCPWCGGPL